MRALGLDRERLVGSLGALGSSLAVAAVALLIMLVLIAIIGYSPTDTASAFIDGAFGGSHQLAGTVTVMIPLVLIGLAWIVASSARQINLGLEGQVLMGGLGATLAGTNLDGLSAAPHLALTVIAGALAGAIWALLPAILYVLRDVSVLLSSFMLNFVGALLIAYLIRGPLKNPGGLGLIESSPIDLSALWPKLGSSGLRWDVMLIPAAVIALTVIQHLTTVGFRLRLISASESAAQHMGISTKRVAASALLCSGALAGIAGSSLILDSFTGSLTENFASGYGFIGIAVALLARNSAVGCVASALLFAALQQGGSLVETRVGVPSSSVEVAQGLVIVLVGLSGWLLLKVARDRPEAALAPEIDGTV
ncbi:MAG TPA: ABC transporter permease [Solirubrobacterales bacterium]